MSFLRSEKAYRHALTRWERAELTGQEFSPWDAESYRAGYLAALAWMTKHNTDPLHPTHPLPWDERPEVINARTLLDPLVLRPPASRTQLPFGSTLTHAMTMERQKRCAR